MTEAKITQTEGMIPGLRRTIVNEDGTATVIEGRKQPIDLLSLVPVSPSFGGGDPRMTLHKFLSLVAKEDGIAIASEKASPPYQFMVFWRNKFAKKNGWECGQSDGEMMRHAKILLEDYGEDMLVTMSKFYFASDKWDWQPRTTRDFMGQRDKVIFEMKKYKGRG